MFQFILLRIRIMERLWNERLGKVERVMASYPEEESLVSHFIGAVCELV